MLGMSRHWDFSLYVIIVLQRKIIWCCHSWFSVSITFLRKFISHKSWKIRLSRSRRLSDVTFCLSDVTSVTWHIIEIDTYTGLNRGSHWHYIDPTIIFTRWIVFPIYEDHRHLIMQIQIQKHVMGLMTSITTRIQSWYTWRNSSKVSRHTPRLWCLSICSLVDACSVQEQMNRVHRHPWHPQSHGNVLVILHNCAWKGSGWRHRHM